MLVANSLATDDVNGSSSSTSEGSDSDVERSSADSRQGVDERIAGEDGKEEGGVVVSGTLVVDSESANSLLGVVHNAGGRVDHLGRPGVLATLGKDLPTRREPSGLATWFLEDDDSDGGDDDDDGFLRPGVPRESDFPAEAVVDAPEGDGEEDAVGARFLPASAVRGEEAGDVVPSAYRFRDGAAPLTLVCVVGPFLLLFFPSVKSGFLLSLSPPTFGFFALFDVGALFLPLSVKFPPPPTTTAAAG